MQVERMPMVRVFFSKTGRAKYISHLDVVRLFTRAFRRSGLPFWYTQGFNPHLYMTFALPLPLGYEGLRESVDLRLTRETPPDEVVGRMARALPPDFQVLEAAPPVCAPGEIVWGDYRIQLDWEGADSSALQRELEEFLAQEAIPVAKRTKKGEQILDVKPLTRLLSLEAGEGSLELLLRCAAGIHLNIPPALLLEAFYLRLGEPPRRAAIVREAILRENLEIFR